MALQKRKRSGSDDGVYLDISINELDEYLDFGDDITIEFSNGNKYDGEVCDGIPNGYGIYTWRDGSVYEGLFVFCKRHGRGIMNQNGHIYNGEWVAGQRVGHGTFTWPTGAVFNGKWINDNANGSGTFTWPNGAVFNGYWENGKRQGEGIITHDGTVYDGYWIDDQEVIIEEEDDEDDDEDDEDIEENKDMGASEEDIENATEVGHYGEIINPRNSDQCAIRLAPFEDGNNVMRITHCNHLFFQQELAVWLQRKGTCPVCRHNIRPP